jgi:hypothetical protein
MFLRVLFLGISHEFSARGRDLSQVADVCKEFLNFARSIGFRDGADMIVTIERTVASLRGLTRGLSNFNDDEFDEAAFEAGLTAARMPLVTDWYWTRKVMLHFLSGDYVSLGLPTRRSRSLHQGRPSPAYGSSLPALAIAACIEQVPAEQRHALRKRLPAHYEQLKAWSEETRSPTFADKHVLISAETARLDGVELEAERLYEESIRLAQQNGFVQNEAIANELAARFHAARGFKTIALAYLREARYCYLRWGAHGKVRQLEALHPHAWGDQRTLGSTATLNAPVGHLDVATMFKASQAVSSEIVMSSLIETLMRFTVEHAGAEQGLLILRNGEPGLPQRPAPSRGRSRSDGGEDIVTP